MPQRARISTKAKDLLSQAGHPNGFATDLYTEDYQEMKNFAQIIKQAAARISASTSSFTWTTSPTTTGTRQVHWLSGTMSLVDYGHRGVPNVVLAAPLLPRGCLERRPLRQLHQYDGLVAAATWPALDLATQRKIRRADRARCCWTRRRYIVAYYFDSISVTKKPVAGVVTTGMGQIYLSRPVR